MKTFFWMYLGGALDLADYFSKKIRVIRQFNQNILQETCCKGKNHAFSSSPCSWYTSMCTTYVFFLTNQRRICLLLFWKGGYSPKSAPAAGFWNPICFNLIKFQSALSICFCNVKTGWRKKGRDEKISADPFNIFHDKIFRKPSQRFSHQTFRSRHSLRS